MPRRQLTEPRRGDTGSGPQRVLITGAASGLGLALTREYLGRGDHVIVTDLHATAPPNVAALAGSWEYRKLDVTSQIDWDTAAAAIDDLDVLVNNAGIAAGGSLEATSIDTWHRIIDLNLLSVVRGCTTFVPKIKRNGRIVITASAAGLVHAPLMSAYNSTKASVVALGETLAAELRPRGISTTIVCPQFFKSGLAESLSGDDATADDVARLLLGHTPLTAETIARRALRGIDRRRVIVTPDALSTGAWYSKRYARLPYLKMMGIIGHLGNQVAKSTAQR